jgi:hypothetical protein
MTDPVSVLRESTPLFLPARLTLRLRDQDQAPERARLRVFRKDSGTGTGQDAGIPPGEIDLIDFEGGKGVSFPISRFGSYLVAAEKDR